MVTVEEWRELGTTFDWRGHRIFHRIEGEGEPLLLVHGFPTASWDWARLWPALVTRYRVLALDLIGFGLSAKPRDFAYSIMAQADLIAALLERERTTRYRLVAHDMGVTVAQELLARQRDPSAPQIVAACLLNGGLFPETHRALPTQKLLASPIGFLVARFVRYAAFAKSMRRIWGTHPIGDAELRAMWQLVTAANGQLVLPKLLGYMAERRRHRERWIGAIVDPPAPVRLINGLADPVSGAHMIARYRELVSNPNVVELPGVGHYPQVETPEQVLAAILAHFGLP